MLIQQAIIPVDALSTQREFYVNVLGLPLIEESGARLVIQVGASRLIFESRLGAYPTHFALDMPEHQYDDAYEWMSAKLSLVANDRGDSQIHHKGWDAHALYFYDPAGNNVEFIARHTRPTALDAPFSPALLTRISEVGIVTHDVRSVVASLVEQIGVEVYDNPGSTEFCAVGSDEGLLIVVAEGRAWYPDGKLSARLSPTQLLISQQDMLFELSTEPFHIQRIR